MDTIARTSGCAVYCGDDIALAVEQSAIAESAFASRPFRRFESVPRFFKDLRNANYRELVPRSCLVTGKERDSGDIMTIGFSGTLRVVDFCASAILGNDDYERIPAALSGSQAPDILVSDHPLASPLLHRPASFRIPTWVRQQRRIGKNWADTLSAMSTGLHKEIGRILRRYKYRVKISSGIPAIRDYYRKLHAPYLRKRFGSDTILASEIAFLSQSRHMTRLDLTHDDIVVGASLLELRHPELAIRSSSMHPDIENLQGRADALDYFSLLFAQLLHCESLDFGLSRPHLENGPLRYKAKWGAALSPAGGLKSDIQIAPLNYNEATLAFLRRNYFIQRLDDHLSVRVLYDQHAARESLQRLIVLPRTPGLASIELVITDSEAQPEIPPESGLTLRPIGDQRNLRDPLNAIVAKR